MPEIFEDVNNTFQMFPYEMRISLGNTSEIVESENFSSKSEISRYNLLGQKVKKKFLAFKSSCMTMEVGRRSILEGAIET